MDQLGTVHQALQSAQLKSAKINPTLEAGSFRVKSEIKEKADMICKQHGTTLSEFIAECLTLLVQDYIGKIFKDEPPVDAEG